MKIQIDLKSLLLGLVLGAGILFTVGAGVSEPVGRYQITAVNTGSGGSGAAFVVDTVTGEVWAGEMRNDKADAFWQKKKNAE